jgi:tRNA A-37 threonylcarbamoyl transferase component Bud32
MSGEPIVTIKVGDDGRYELVEELGRGGNGVVYRARDTRFPDKDVAVKLLHAESEQARADMQQEIRHLSQIDDPYVLKTTDWGKHGESIFMVTEYVKADTLMQMVDQHRATSPGGFDPLFAANVGGWIARALIAVHRAGVVHRDLTPNNVMLQGSGHAATIHAVKLIDFGLASQRGVSHEEAKGTPHYVAPEILKRHPVSFNTDIYALGCIVFELVMGEPPYPSNDPQEVVNQHSSDEPAPRMNSGHQDFDELVARMLSKNPVDRADSTARVADALSRVAYEIQRSRTIPRAVGPQLPPEVTRKLPLPALVSTDELGAAAVPTSAQLAEPFAPTWRRPALAVALMLAVVGLAFVASRIAGPPAVEVPPAPLVEAPPPPAPAIEPIAVAPVAPEPLDELAPVAPLPKPEDPKPKPAVAKPAEPKFSCEPTPEWKALMRGKLEALEGVGNALEPVVLLAEIGKVGRAVNEASTAKDCARVSAMYEALHKRAVK